MKEYTNQKTAYLNFKEEVRQFKKEIAETSLYNFGIRDLKNRALELLEDAREYQYDQFVPLPEQKGLINILVKIERVILEGDYL